MDQPADNIAAISSMKTQNISSSWSPDEDLALLRRVRVVAATTPASNSVNGTIGSGLGMTGNYARALEKIDWNCVAYRLNSDLPAKQLGYNKSSGDHENASNGSASIVSSGAFSNGDPSKASRSAEDVKQRLTQLLNKVPKQRTLSELVSQAESVTLIKQLEQQDSNSKADSIRIDEVSILWKYLYPALQSYINGKSDRKLNKNSSLDKEALKTRYKKKWMTMTAFDQLKRIKRYCRHTKQGVYNENPTTFDFHADSSSRGAIFTGSEVNLSQNLQSKSLNSSVNLDKSKSKKKKLPLLKDEPKAVPTNPYALFTKQVVARIGSELTSKDRLLRVSQEWKTCTDEEKKRLSGELHEMQQEYYAKLDKFYKEIDNEEDKRSFEERHKSKIGRFIAVTKTDS